MQDIIVSELLSLKQELRFQKGKKFKILVLSDLHGGVGCSEQMPRGVEETVKAVAPDLVLLNGDTAGPGRIHVSSKDDLRELLDKVAAPMEKRGIPWCQTFGNHDNNYGVDNRTAQEVYDAYPHCVSKLGDPTLSGAGNYVLPIRASDSDAIAFNLWGLDSHDDMSGFNREFGMPEDTRYVLPQHFCYGRGYDTVHVNQVMWYYQASEKLEAYNGAKIPGVMCFHIPLPEFKLCVDNKNHTKYTGHMLEDVGCGEMNSGLFMALLERGDVKAVCCGHDHVNDFCGEYCGVKLCYDGGMDYDAYQHDEIRGGRVFEIDENDPWNFSTYMVRVKDIMGEAGNKIKAAE